MKKYKTRQNDTLKGGLFTQCFPKAKMVGKQKEQNTHK
jgi:hypothetical protein